jgi:hypothetical protein
MKNKSIYILGTPYVRINPERIKGIVLTEKFDSSKSKNKSQL